MLGRVTRQLDESLVVLDDLMAVAPETVAPVLENVRTERRRLLVELVELERSAGELPAAGEPEHAHLQAIGTALHAKLSAQDDSQILRERLLGVDEDLASAVEQARNDERVPRVVRPALDHLAHHLSESARQIDLGLAPRSER